MKVSAENAELIDYSKRLDNKLKNENLKKENEIKNISELYDKKIEIAKTQGQDKYISALTKNDELLSDASKDYEAKLNSYKENLGKTQSTLAREEVVIKDDHQNKIENFKDQFLSNTLEQFKNASDKQSDINSQMKNSIDNITDKSLAERRHIETSAKSNISALASEFNSKEANEERNFRAKLANDIRMHQEESKNQLTEIKSQGDKNTEKNKRLVNEKLTVQKGELDFLDNHQKDVINQKTADFKVRYENLVKEHNDLLTELKDHFETDVKKMIESTVSQRRVIANKSADSFYRIETLDPKISENEKEYMVSLAVPEHERENVHLSAKGRGVKMTLTRRFAETFEEQDGSTNRSTKNELFSREFPCKDLLNPKLVDQKYENGVLTYRIQKL